MGVKARRASAVFANPLRLFGGKKSSKNSGGEPKKSVRYDFENTRFHAYEGVQAEDWALYYPDLTELQVRQEFRKQIMHGYLKGSAAFKESVEKLYNSAHKNYDEAELSSNEFSLEMANDDIQVYAVVKTEIRGLEEFYCSVITDHRTWAVKKVVSAQRDKALRKKVPDIAKQVAVRSKNFARLVALGDAEEAMVILGTTLDVDV